MVLPRIPRVAIVGRPNVGKSSLLNMLAGAKVSIVDPTPGVTRDRVVALVELEGPDPERDPVKLAELIDTGGYGVYTADGARYDDIGADLTQLSGPIEEQIGEAVRSADLILFVIDTQSGVTGLDLTIADLLRKQAFSPAGKDGEPKRRVPIMVVANKTDGDNWEAHAQEASRLGFGPPEMVSAMNNFRRRTFTETVYAALPESSTQAEAPSQPEMMLAVVGKRNAGKSTFVNALAGEERVIVSEIAGTTRDAVDVRFELDGHAFVAIDTAGFRKRKSLADEVEQWATHRALRSIRRADVVLMLVDATAPISQVDKRLSSEIQDQFKPCVIVVNKWDQASGRKGRGGKVVTTEDYQKYLEKELRGLARSPIIFTTATDGTNVRAAVGLAMELHEQACMRVSTSALNKYLRGILETRGPSSKLGTKVKILFVSQVSTNPPTIIMVVNHAELFDPEYERYIRNRLAEVTPFTEIPIRLIIRDRKRARLEDLLSGAHRAKRAAQGDESENDTRRRGDEPDRDSRGRPIPPKMPRMVHGLADDDSSEEDDALITKMLAEFDQDEA